MEVGLPVYARGHPALAGIFNVLFCFVFPSLDSSKDNDIFLNNLTMPGKIYQTPVLIPSDINFDLMGSNRSNFIIMFTSKTNFPVFFSSS